MSINTNHEKNLEFSGLAEETSLLNPACQIACLFDQVQRSCAATRDLLSQFREALISCSQCPTSVCCELSEQFNLLVDQAVSNIIEEWGW
ncbi:MAG: hypothetical protein ACK2UM_02220 [Anaerolineales bacterium]